MLETQMQEIESLLKRKKEEVKLLLQREISIQIELKKMSDEISLLYDKKKSVEAMVDVENAKLKNIEDSIRNEYAKKEAMLAQESYRLGDREKTLLEREHQVKESESVVIGKESILNQKISDIYTSLEQLGAVIMDTIREAQGNL